MEEKIVHPGASPEAGGAVARPPGDAAPSAAIVRVFTERGDFRAFDSASEWLESLGYSVGRMQRGAPCGVLFGRYDIAKWRNLSRAEREALDGTLVGNFRDGPVQVDLRRAPVTRGATAPEGAGQLRDDLK